MRMKVALRNLYISQAIILIFLIYAWWMWFPYSFSQLGGFHKTAFMLIFVDLVLGPLLVWTVYREGKKYLAFDINVLLAIQLAAFIYGAWMLYLKHPAYAVFNVDRFVLTNVSSLYPTQPSIQQFRTSFFSQPEMVIAELPREAKEQSELIFDIVINNNPDITHRPKYYKAAENHHDKILAKSLKPDMLFSNAARQAQLIHFISKHGGTTEDYAYFPLKGNDNRSVVWVLDKQDMQPIGIIDINPWLQTTMQKQVL